MQVTRFISARRNQVFQCRPTPTLLARSELRERSVFEYDLMRASLTRKPRSLLRSQTLPADLSQSDLV